MSHISSFMLLEEGNEGRHCTPLSAGDFRLYFPDAQAVVFADFTNSSFSQD